MSLMTDIGHGWWKSRRIQKRRTEFSYILIRSSVYFPAVNKAQTLAPFAGAFPKLADNVFVAPNASVVGDVKIGQGSSIFYGAVLRGEFD